MVNLRYSFQNAEKLYMVSILISTLSLYLSLPFQVSFLFIASFHSKHVLCQVMDYFSGGSMYFHICNERFPFLFVLVVYVCILSIDWLPHAHATSRYFEPRVVKFFAMELVLAIGHLHKQDIGKI
jgi:serine/threonine protein kinase